MRGIPRAICAAGLIAFGATAAKAEAQTINFGVGMAGATSKVMPGAVMTYAIGTDIPLSDRWSVRIEAGRRLPDTKTWHFTTQRFLPHPEAPTDPRRAIRADSRSTLEETSLADVALLFRFGSSPARPVQFAALAGVDLQMTTHHTVTFIPQSVTDPGDALETVHDGRRLHMLLALGVDAAFRVDDRWTLTTYGTAGLQSPLVEDRRPQLRAGVFASYRF